MWQSAQYRIRDAGFSDSIIACWQRSKEFCNKIGPSLHEPALEIASGFGGVAEVVDDKRQPAAGSASRTQPTLESSSEAAFCNTRAAGHFGVTLSCGSAGCSRHFFGHSGKK
jgi:hypothetical protein